jgi:hypothetical protein
MKRKPSEQRMCQHEHNGHMGRARMIEMCLNSIITSRTTTKETKELCEAILLDISYIRRKLKFRVNADGTQVEVGKKNVITEI